MAPPPDFSPIRLARSGEADAVGALVGRAYTPWIAVIGRRPAPMDDDFAAHIAAGEVFVLPAADTIAAVAVLIGQPDHLLIDNLAVEPAFKGTGLGRALLRFAEAETRRRGLLELRLFTHARMAGNIALYERSGFQVTHRATVDGFDRVFMHRLLDEG